MEIHVVALEASSPLANYPKSQASGLLIWSAAGFPLILTTCLIKPGSSLRVALPGARSAERVVVEADLKASTRIRQACEAFRSLESRGWRCGEQTDGLHLHLLRPSTGCLKPSCGLPGCFSDPCERWISREIKLLFCPFGARTLRAGARPSAWSVVTRGRKWKCEVKWCAYVYEAKHMESMLCARRHLQHLSTTWPPADRCHG